MALESQLGPAVGLVQIVQIGIEQQQVGQLLQQALGFRQVGSSQNMIAFVAQHLIDSLCGGGFLLSKKNFSRHDKPLNSNESIARRWFLG